MAVYKIKSTLKKISPLYGNDTMDTDTESDADDYINTDSNGQPA